MGGGGGGEWGDLRRGGGKASLLFADIKTILENLPMARRKAMLVCLGLLLLDNSILRPEPVFVNV